MNKDELGKLLTAANDLLLLTPTEYEVQKIRYIGAAAYALIAIAEILLEREK